MAAFGINPALAQEMGKAAGRSDKPLKAAFSNAGLQATWCAQGKQAAEYWGKLFNVEVTWFDGELAAQKQRAFELGDSNTDLSSVMLATTKAQVSFRAMVEVRNRVISAYQDIMNMPL